MSGRLIDRARELGIGDVRGEGVATCGRALILLGWAEAALALHPFETAPSVRQGLHESYAVCLAHLGRFDEIRVYLADPLEPYGGDAPVLFMAQLCEAALLARDRRAVEIIAPKLNSNTQIMIGPGGVQLCALGRVPGAAAALLGEPTEARVDYQKALEDCQRIRFRPEIALIRLELAELLLEHYPQEQAEAHQHLDFAIAEFQEMKMQPALERALKHKGLLHA